MQSFADHFADDIVLPPTQLLIGGEWREAARRTRFGTINPATEETIAEVAEGGAADIDAAVAAARAALKRGPWPVMSRRGARPDSQPPGRDHARAAARNWSCSKASTAASRSTATRRMDLPAAIDCLEYYAGWADKITGEVVPTRRDALTYVQRVPVGVVAVIVPWNFALMNAVWKIAPALACGCTVVLKPAELTPLSALWLGAAALEAGSAARRAQYRSGLRRRGRRGAGRRIRASTRLHSPARRAPASSSCARRPKTSPGSGWSSAASRRASCSPMPIWTRRCAQTASGAFFNAGQVCSAATRVVVDRTHPRCIRRQARGAGAVAAHGRSARRRRQSRPDHFPQADGPRARLHRRRPGRRRAGRLRRRSAPASAATSCSRPCCPA